MEVLVDIEGVSFDLHPSCKTHCRVDTGDHQFGVQGGDPDVSDTGKGLFLPGDLCVDLGRCRVGQIRLHI